ncbi:YolD-like family protein [Thermoflavimicrobium daqui]|nr:YolD-like family protein [Thermoflavimicrobium daqui]
MNLSYKESLQPHPIILSEAKDKHRIAKSTRIDYRQSTLNPEQVLQFSTKIQLAYEQERPLVVIYQMPDGDHHFAGYMGHLDQHERWIQLINGSLSKQISLAKVVHIDLY